MSRLGFDQMANLPVELWGRIMEIGIETPDKKLLSYKDLCCLSISCRRLNRLSCEESLWSLLLSSDFPQFDANKNKCSSPSPNNNRPTSSKALYRIWFERDKARKLAAHQRAVLRVESLIAQYSRKLREIQLQKMEETEKMKATASELSYISKARQASVALNVWQPEVVRGRHKQIIEQCPVPANSRIHALEMELKLCKQQITGLDKAYRDEMRRLESAKEQLASMKYHPLQSQNLTSNDVGGRGMKRKKGLIDRKTNCFTRT